jgi:deazaflavin-dependent oxidoreductase (nitroreductase family)
MPNAFQKLIHRFLALRPVSAVLSRTLHRIDSVLFKLTGKQSFAELVGLPIVQIKTVGARSHAPHTIPLVGLPDGEKIILIGTNFGKRHNPGWYYNLKVNPGCEAVRGGQAFRFEAREVFGQEYEMYWTLALSYYSGYQKYRERATPRRIPILLLEPMAFSRKVDKRQKVDPSR